jgi:dTMP kinase
VFIVIEGIEGSGKTTLMFGLAERLRSEGHDAVTTHEPGGTPVSDAIRDLFLRRSMEMFPLTEGLLVNAARAQHVAALIRPAVENGRIVICDRFTDSTLAYQGYGRGLDLELLRDLCKIATQGLGPDLTLLLNAPLPVARTRLGGRPGQLTLFTTKQASQQAHVRMKDRVGYVDRIESEDDAFHERVRQGFLELAHGSARHIVLDGLRSPEDLAEEALREVRSLLDAPVK